MLLAACSPPTGPREVTGPGARPAPAPPPGRLVVAEHAHRGARLVVVDERGRRVRELTTAPSTASIDAQPAFTPDGRFVVFASSRARAAPDQTSLWVVPFAGGDAVRLTEGAAVDLNPAVSPDGRAVAFASTRGGTLDLWLLALEADGDRPPRAGELTRLTDDPGAELSPAWSRDGARLAYTAAPRPREREEMLRDRGGGRATRLCAGEGAVFSPDDGSVVYAARAAGREDADLWLLSLAPGSAPRRLTDAISDEAAPRFSRDGRLVFATAIVRDDTRRAVLSTLVFVDLDDPGAGMRALQEPIPTTRNGADVAPLDLDLRALRGNPRYVDAVRRTLVE
jgi:Tol biopolymer transport system component